MVFICKKSFISQASYRRFEQKVDNVELVKNTHRQPQFLLTHCTWSFSGLQEKGIHDRTCSYKEAREFSNIRSALNGHGSLCGCGDISLGAQISFAAAHTAETIRVFPYSIFFCEVTGAFVFQAFILRGTTPLETGHILLEHVNVHMDRHVTATVCLSWAGCFFLEVNAILHGINWCTLEALQRSGCREIRCD